MSTHQNPDGSISLGVKTEPAGQFVAHEFLTVGTTVTALSDVASAVADGANQAEIQNTSATATVSYRLDGANPTASVGMAINAGDSVKLNMTDAANIKLIASAAGTPVAVSYTM